MSFIEKFQKAEGKDSGRLVTGVSHSGSVLLFKNVRKCTRIPLGELLTKAEKDTKPKIAFFI